MRVSFQLTCEHGMYMYETHNPTPDHHRNLQRPPPRPPSTPPNTIMRVWAEIGTRRNSVLSICLALGPRNGQLGSQLHSKPYVTSDGIHHKALIISMPEKREQGGREEPACTSFPETKVPSKRNLHPH